MIRVVRLLCIALYSAVLFAMAPASAQVPSADRVLGLLRASGLESAVAVFNNPNSTQAERVAAANAVLSARELTPTQKGEIVQVVVERAAQAPGQATTGGDAASAAASAFVSVARFMFPEIQSVTGSGLGAAMVGLAASGYTAAATSVATSATTADREIALGAQSGVAAAVTAFPGAAKSVVEVAAAAVASGGEGTAQAIANGLAAAAGGLTGSAQELVQAAIAADPTVAAIVPTPLQSLPVIQPPVTFVVIPTCTASCN